MVRIFFVFLFLGIFINNAFAKQNNQIEKVPNAYFRDNYGIDDNFSSFKVYGLWSIINTNETNFPEISLDLSEMNQKKNINLIKYGYGAGMSIATFFTNNIGVEFGATAIGYVVNPDQLGNIQNNYTQKDKTPGSPERGIELKKTQSPGKIDDATFVYSIPVHIALQFCFAPYGGVRPYVGGGYHMNYTYSPSKAFDIDFMHGPIIQAGVDFVGNDYTIYNIEIKKYFVAETKINYKDSFLYNAFNTTTDLSPLIISAGIGFKF